ncbi:MAG: DEAD/DEAH box helicase family protein [Candidatus Micrarchaeia archaeon]
MAEATLDLSERDTRNEVIDPQLKKVGWIKHYLKEEVNPVKSDIKNKQYELYSGKVERGVDMFIDYLLLSEDYAPLAIIEAKRFCKDPEAGRIQARSYSKVIESKIGYKVPIFLTNGHIWQFIDQDGIERRVSGVFSQEDLKRRHENYLNRRLPSLVKISGKIVDRPRSMAIVKALSEHFSNGHRSALIQMATGTGKTRVSMATIDVLANANYVRNVLFIADRIALANQAKSDGFKRFFTEPVADLRDGISKTSRFYITTVQTLTSGKRSKTYEKFSPAYFDLIVFDEAHRSLYDRNNILFKYFDSIKIGLTATPTQEDSRDTFDLFECDVSKPTVEYSYDEAVHDGILVPYRGETIETKVLALGIEGKELSPELKDLIRKQELDPEGVAFSGGEFDRVFMDDKTNELVIRRFMERCYKSDEGKPAKTIFFCASQKHAKHLKKVFTKIYPSLGNDVQVITSDMHRAEDEVRRFKNDSEPRIALSVGMLDTGIDVPEVCNLVFVKPVYSTVRFWQMVGRGTRNQNSCRHPDWLQDKEKKDFLILDFKIGGHSNIEYHKFRSSKESSRMDVMTRIFINRVKLLNKTLDKTQKAIIIKKIMEDIENLNKDSFIVREKLAIIKKLESDSFNLEKYIEELNKDISPLMMLNSGINSYTASFILNAEKLFGLILDNRRDAIEEIRASTLMPMVENVLRRTNLTEVKEKLNSLKLTLQDKFWNELTFESVEFLIREIAPLMKYYSPDPRKVIQIDAFDIITDIQEFKKEVKEDEKLKELLEKNPLVRKLRDGDGLTMDELRQLVEIFQKIRPEITIPNIQQSTGVDFMVFLHETIGMRSTYDPRERIERQFDDFIIKNSHYNSKQLEFLHLLKRVFVEQKHLEIQDLGTSPLSDQRPLDLFEMEQLEMIVKSCQKIKFK